MRTINGLEPIQDGSITVDGIRVQEQKNLVPLRREVGFVFQSFNLYPHMSVLQNVTLARKVRGMGKEEAEELACACLTGWVLGSSP